MLEKWGQNSMCCFGVHNINSVHLCLENCNFIGQERLQERATETHHPQHRWLFAVPLQTLYIVC